MLGDPTVLLKDDDRHRKFTGVDKFHKKGYYGSRVTAATGESWSLSYYNPGNLVSDPLSCGSGGSGHSVDTAATFFQVAPQAKLVMLQTSSRLTSNGKDSYDHFIDLALPVIKEKKITNMFTSLNHQYDSKTKSDWENALRSVESYFKSFFAMGNDSDRKYNPITDIEEIIGVAAYTLMVDGTVVPAGYSSESDTTDFAAPSMIYTNIDATKTSDSGSPHSGTSFSTPWLCGMACLVDDFFIDKTGEPLSREAMVRFFKDHTVDIGDLGFDKKTGFGAVILPDPDEIDISKYATIKEDDSSMSEVQDMSKYMSFTHTEDSAGVTVEVIPHDAIKKLDFMKCKDPKEKLVDLYDRLEDKPQIVINGGLFNISNGVNILSFIDEGVEQNYQNNFEGIGIKKGDATRLVAGHDKDGDWKDFMSAYPVLVRDGKAVTSYDKGTELNYNAMRQAIGYKADGSVIIISAYRSGAMKFEALSQLMIKYGAQYAINLDGGGSVYKMIGGEVDGAPTEQRAIDNAFMVYLNEKQEAKAYSDTVYATKDINMVAGIGSDNVVKVIEKGSLITIRAYNPWEGKQWYCVSCDYEIGYIVIDNNVTYEMPLPAILRVTEDINDKIKKNTRVLTIGVGAKNDGYFTIIAIGSKDEKGKYTIFESIDTMTISADKVEYYAEYTGDLPGQDDKKDEKEPKVTYTDLNPFEEYTVSAKNGLNIRDKDNISGEIVGALEADMHVVIDRVSTEGWARIRYIGVDDPSTVLTKESEELWVKIEYLNYFQDCPEDSDGMPETVLLDSKVEGIGYFNTTDFVVYPFKYSAEGSNDDVINSFLGSFVEIIDSSEYRYQIRGAHTSTSPCVWVEKSVLNVIELKETPDDKKDDSEKSGIEDEIEISDWAKDSVNHAIEKGWMTCYNRKFRPKDSVTREELAVILNRIEK